MPPPEEVGDPRPPSPSPCLRTGGGFVRREPESRTRRSRGRTVWAVFSVLTARSIPVRTSELVR